MTHKFSPTDIQKLDDNIEREKATIQIFNQAMEQNDGETAQAVSEFVINNPNIEFSRSWQFHCLKWLTAHYITRWQNSPDDSKEEEITQKGLIECLWKHKWLVGTLPYDIGISKQEIDEAAESMAELYENFDFGLAMVHKAKLEQNMYMGNIEAAKHHFAKWQAENENEDAMNDCDACEQHTLIEYHHFIGHHKQVWQLAKPILSGEMTCGEVPHISYPFIIDSLIQLGEMEYAQDILNDAIELIRNSDKQFLRLMSKLIRLAVQLDQHELAEELLDEFSSDIVEAIQNSHYDYLQYLIAVASFNEEALLAAHGLAKDFDERNGNHHYQNQLNFQFISPILH